MGMEILQNNSCLSFVPIVHREKWITNVEKDKWITISSRCNCLQRWRDWRVGICTAFNRPKVVSVECQFYEVEVMKIHFETIVVNIWHRLSEG
jgi:hypothetical protein